MGRLILDKKFKSAMILGIFAVLAVILLLFEGQLTGQAVQESAQRPLLKCGDTITQKMLSPIILTDKDPITQAPCRNGKGLIITGFNKVLDCKKLSITGATNRFIGIEVKGSGNEVRNCKISGFETGIELSYASRNLLLNNVFEQLSFGIKLTGKSKKNHIKGNFFATEEADILWKSYAGKNVLLGNDFFGKKSIDLQTQHLPQVCEGNAGNYLAPGTEEPLLLQEKSLCGISKEPLTAEGKGRRNQK